MAVPGGQIIYVVRFAEWACSAGLADWAWENFAALIALEKIFREVDCTALDGEVESLDNKSSDLLPSMLVKTGESRPGYPHLCRRRGVVETEVV